MFIRPNDNAQLSVSRQKNDLYRKFRDFFTGATEKEFQKFDSYGVDGYVSVNPMVEERIFDTLAHNINEIVPITGATGIGKTYLLLYCLKKYYKQNDISTNNPQLFFKDGGYDLVYYSDFTTLEKSVLTDSSKIILAKISAMYDCIEKMFSDSKPNVKEYIDNNKLEVKYYPERNNCFETELFKLSLLLGIDDVKINNIVFIFDDLESLEEKNQFALMDQFLTLYDNFKSKSKGKYNSKFIFSLRSSTYYNIYQQDFYNTHRASKASYLTVTPSLSDIFQKRFEIILKSEKVKKAKNKKTWEHARDILVNIAQRIDNSYANLLLKLNNNNISKALDDFLNILSNRRWTQKNVNPAASFSIEQEDYYINDANVLRILSMGEGDVYYQLKSMSLRCVLPNPGVVLLNDLISLLVLRIFRHKTVGRTEDPSTMILVSEEDCVAQITEIFLLPDETNFKINKERIQNAVHNAFEYYAENRFIKENNNSRESNRPENVKYFMLPRGEQTFDLFFSQAILFSIFRDTFLWNDQEFSVMCSNELSFDELIEEATKYEHKLINFEKRLFQKITANKTWRAYISNFGRWSVSDSFLNAINKSIQQYYRESKSIPKNIMSCISDYQISVNELLDTFNCDLEEDFFL